MTVESATYISQLDTTLPTAADLISEGDDHIRLTKTVLKTQFPNFGTNAVTASAAELNYSVGVTSPIQPQLNTKANSASPTFTGTVVLPANTSIGSITAAEIARLAGIAFPIQGQIDARGAIAGQAWTGAHSFGGTVAVPNLAQGANTTGAASAAFVQAEWSTRLPNYSEPITASSTELSHAAGVTGPIQAQLNSKGASAGQVWTGAHDFTSAAISVPTATAGDSSSKAASTAFVVGTAFSAALPGQAGSAGRYLTTDGTSASWASLEIDALSITYNGNGSIATLTEDGVVKTFAYNGDGTINTVSWPIGALTRTETYSYSSGVLTGMAATEV